MFEEQRPRGETAVIVIDMLNRYEHEDADALCASVERALPAMHDVVEDAARNDVSLVYVNDNYGDWSASRAELSENALGGRRPAWSSRSSRPRESRF